ncbi:hypothetical protein Nepgr_015178 [Nepenthes gracilis]|uniref:Uncharacterized protein n=1 Tax=Nepenthes gracilis TaxID=150966 RepID=A0AAD3SMT1_NEPGR|nr:hypothetical protein Nepgr_015178 [Nepenthes gracilis]
MMWLGCEDEAGVFIHWTHCLELGRIRHDTSENIPLFGTWWIDNKVEFEFHPRFVEGTETSSLGTSQARTQEAGILALAVVTSKFRPDDSPASQLQSCVDVLAPVEPDSMEEENDILSSIEDGPLVINQHPTFLPSDENISTPMPRITRKSRRTRNAPQHLQQYHYQEAQQSSYCASSF